MNNNMLNVVPDILNTQGTSGNTLSKLLIGPLFGFIAGWVAAVSLLPTKASNARQSEFSRGL